MAKRRSASASRQRPAAPRGGGGGSATTVDIICSDCHEDWSFNLGGGVEEIICPVCEHSCDLPEDAQVHRIADLKKKEKVNFIIVFVLTLLAVGCWFLFLFLARDPSVGPNGNAAAFYGTIGPSLLCSLGLMIMLFKYESNRWETYF